MDWMLAKLKSNNTRILSFLMSEGLKFRLSGAFVSKTNIDCGAVWFKTFKRCKQTLQRGELSPPLDGSKSRICSQCVVLQR